MKILEINGQRCPILVSETISLLNSIFGDVIISASSEITFKTTGYEKYRRLRKLIANIKMFFCFGLNQLF